MTTGISLSEQVWAWRCSVTWTTQISATKNVTNMNASDGWPAVATGSSEATPAFRRAPHTARTPVRIQIDSDGTCRCEPRRVVDVTASARCRARPADARPRDAGPAHAGPRDAGPADAGPRDAGPADAGPAD